MREVGCGVGSGQGGGESGALEKVGFCIVIGMCPGIMQPRQLKRLQSYIFQQNSKG